MSNLYYGYLHADGNPPAIPASSLPSDASARALAAIPFAQAPQATTTASTWDPASAAGVAGSLQSSFPLPQRQQSHLLQQSQQHQLQSQAQQAQHAQQQEQQYQQQRTQHQQKQQLQQQILRHQQQQGLQRPGAGRISPRRNGRALPAQVSPFVHEPSNSVSRESALASSMDQFGLSSAHSATAAAAAAAAAAEATGAGLHVGGSLPTAGHFPSSTVVFDPNEFPSLAGPSIPNPPTASHVPRGLSNGVSLLGRPSASSSLGNVAPLPTNGSAASAGEAVSGAQSGLQAIAPHLQKAPLAGTGGVSGLQGEMSHTLPPPEYSDMYNLSAYGVGRSKTVDALTGPGATSEFSMQSEDFPALGARGGKAPGSIFGPHSVSHLPQTLQSSHAQSSQQAQAQTAQQQHMLRGGGMNSLSPAYEVERTPVSNLGSGSHRSNGRRGVAGSGGLPNGNVQSGYPLPSSRSVKASRHMLQQHQSQDQLSSVTSSHQSLPKGNSGQSLPPQLSQQYPQRTAHQLQHAQEHQHHIQQQQSASHSKQLQRQHQLQQQHQLQLQQQQLQRQSDVHGQSHELQRAGIQSNTAAQLSSSQQPQWTHGQSVEHYQDMEAVAMGVAGASHGLFDKTESSPKSSLGRSDEQHAVAAHPMNGRLQAGIPGALTPQESETTPGRIVAAQSSSVTGSDLKSSISIETQVHDPIEEDPPASSPEHYGMKGLLRVLKPGSEANDLFLMSIGLDLTRLGLNLNSAGTLYSALETPWDESPTNDGQPDSSLPASVQRKNDPEFTLPDCYYMQAPPLKPNHFSIFQVETLFYVFYSMPGEVLQLLAAIELNNREWRYNKDVKLWFTRAPGGTPGFDHGTAYIYFDISNWERRPFHEANQKFVQGLMTEDELRATKIPAHVANFQSS